MTPADLRVFRARHDLSQPRLAAFLGVTTSTVLRWEKARAPIPAWLELALEGLKSRLMKELAE